jgi:glutamyl-tRNA synthetase
MSAAAHVTRFAPSPTGSLHLGNARTALFSWLAARATGGRFVLRVEDTDAERSHEALLERQLEELRWFGLDWDEGPDVGGLHGRYRQSQRAPIHKGALEALATRGLTYPCFCSPGELEFSRRAQLAAGRPPRYSRTCANLPEHEVRRRLESGLRPAIRFRVPDGQAIVFTDLVHGPQRFMSDDIGDFIVRRADGSVSFFLGNVLDDSAMGITLVVRGDDHLANTPRQLLILEALGMRQPSYAHLPLVLGPDGRPLSKREGASSLTDLRAQGYLPGAIRNYLLRLGHACGTEAWLDVASLAQHFDITRTSRSAARFDEAQLLHWQREAVLHASNDELERWLDARLEPLDQQPHRQAFVAVVRGNVLLPTDVDPLVAIVTGGRVSLEPEAVAQVTEAGPEFFERARDLLGRFEGDFKGWTRAVAEATGRKGARMFMPLRSALTGSTHGPELAPLVALMGVERARERLAAAARMNAQAH